MKAIRTYFNKFIILTDEEWADFEKCLTTEHVKKNSCILHENEICDFIAFIEVGTFRFYSMIEGEEKITAFFFENDFVTNYRSFLTRQPSKLTIEAMQKSVIYKINLNQLRLLYDKHQKIDRLGRLIAENLYLLVANRLDAFMFASPKERYEELVNRNSKLLQEIPQYMIASYLGIKPETLSRIRARI